MDLNKINQRKITDDPVDKINDFENTGIQPAPFGAFFTP